MLSGHRVIDVGLADDLRRIVGVRNRIAHLYGTVGVERLWASCPRASTLSIASQQQSPRF